MDPSPELEELKPILLKELNARRVGEGKAPLAIYPEVGCTSCGEVGEGPIFGSAHPYIRTCQACVLKQFPFDKLRLAPGETIAWYRNNPTFHRTSDYGIVITDRALHLYSPVWWIFSMWRRFPLAEIRNAVFHDSRLFPSLRIRTKHGEAVLRTPPDYAEEMEYDRGNLIEAAERVRSSLAAVKGE